MDYLEEILQAAQRIRPFIRETPLLRSAWLSRESGCEVYLKLENLQHTGSFKLRGAFNKLLSLTPAQRERGVITASSGNHGAALAYALQALNANGTIYVPTDASLAKIAAIRAFGQEVQFYGDDCVETEAFARRQAERHGMIYISPYNDPQIIGGQGTIAVELAKQL
ncbi:MAG: pyridoxal-phosphate dependent enzyme, partial [Calditrichaeota bacterium]|nr:pyridoxal-phosphate dependent enzyme [Calditrichota bacterium]